MGISICKFDTYKKQKSLITNRQKYDYRQTCYMLQRSKKLANIANQSKKGLLNFRIQHQQTYEFEFHEQSTCRIFLCMQTEIIILKIKLFSPKNSLDLPNPQPSFLFSALINPYQYELFYLYLYYTINWWYLMYLLDHSRSMIKLYDIKLVWNNHIFQHDKMVL